jgi:c-di-GMP-binding flagellar brake protein YcgR
MKERRRDVRIIEENRIAIEISGADGREVEGTIRAFTKDLSLGGARLETDKSIDPGSELKMTLYLSQSWQVVKARGRVKWVKEIDHGLYEIGIEFMHEIPGIIMSLISHLFRKQTNIPTDIRNLGTSGTKKPPDGTRRST